MKEYCAGLDLGKTADFTAMVILEIDEAFDEQARHFRRRHAVRYLRRWPLGTPYPAIVADVAATLDKPPLLGAPLVVDQTGVGAAVVDLFRMGGVDGLKPVLITSGNAVSRDDQGVFHVAKKVLVSTLQVLLQERRLQIAPTLSCAETLEMELQNFRVKITAAMNETFEAWRDRDHDDLLLALALAAWHAEKQPLGGQGKPMLLVHRADCQLASVRSLAHLPKGGPS
jgi:hypothetical protein